METKNVGTPLSGILVKIFRTELIRRCRVRTSDLNGCLYILCNSLINASVEKFYIRKQKTFYLFIYYPHELLFVIKLL